jgi:hypothetical protein
MSYAAGNGLDVARIDCLPLYSDAFRVNVKDLLHTHARKITVPGWRRSAVYVLPLRCGSSTLLLQVYEEKLNDKQGLVCEQCRCMGEWAACIRVAEAFGSSTPAAADATETPACPTVSLQRALPVHSLSAGHLRACTHMSCSCLGAAPCMHLQGHHLSRTHLNHGDLPPSHQPNLFLTLHPAATPGAGCCCCRLAAPPSQQPPLPFHPTLPRCPGRPRQPLGRCGSTWLGGLC